MTEANGTTATPRVKLGRPKKEEYLLVVTIMKKVRGTYVKGSSRSLNFTNAKWEPSEFADLVERAARQASGSRLTGKPTTRTVTL